MPKPGGRGGITRTLNSWRCNGVLCILLVAGCQSKPIFIDDSIYRSIEGEAKRTESELAITGADIADGIKRIDHHAAQVSAELDSLEVAISGSGLDDAEKEIILHQVAIVQQEGETLRDQVGILRQDAGRLNDQLAEQRTINAALSAEHDRREAAGAAVKADLEGTKEELAKVKGQRNLYLTILIAVCLGILGYIVFRVLL
jgi:chromosome segregation ATPase